MYIDVNDQNAAGGRAVTAPTNGAAGIIPAVMHYYWKYSPGYSEGRYYPFLLTAAASVFFIKRMLSISGARSRLPGGGGFGLIPWPPLR